MIEPLILLVGGGAAIALLASKKDDSQAVKLAASEAVPIADSLVQAGIPPEEAAFKAVQFVERQYTEPAPPYEAPPPPEEARRDPPTRREREPRIRQERPKKPERAPRPERERPPRPELEHRVRQERERKDPVRIQLVDSEGYKTRGWGVYRNLTGTRTAPREEYWAFPPGVDPDPRRGLWTQM